jgi:hypothetical protein
MLQQKYIGDLFGKLGIYVDFQEELGDKGRIDQFDQHPITNLQLQTNLEQTPKSDAQIPDHGG